MDVWTVTGCDRRFPGLPVEKALAIALLRYQVKVQEAAIVQVANWLEREAQLRKSDALREAAIGLREYGMKMFEVKQ